MKAVIITKPGGSEVLEIQNRYKPVPKSREVLVKVKAAGLNRADILMRKGVYGAGGLVVEVPGLEVSGIIEECGSAVIGWKPGDKVCALLKGGGYAEYAAVDYRLCLPVPEGYSFTEAATLPEAILTVWSNVFQKAKLKAGENFLVHGGSSGIGITAIQLANLFGAKVFATAGTAEKCLSCKKIGALKCVNYREEDFEEVLKSFGIDVILDMVGGNYTPKNLRLLNPEGRLVFIAAIEGRESNINIIDIMSKRLTITGSMLSPRDNDFKAALTDEVRKHVWPLINSGKFQPVIYKVFPLHEAALAHDLMESSEHTGKIILQTEHPL
jgi:NADPH2:quinone reductase